MAKWDSFQEIYYYYSPYNKSKREKKYCPSRLHQNIQYNSTYIPDLSLFLASINMKHWSKFK